MAFLLRLEGITQPYTPGIVRSTRKVETVVKVSPTHSIQAASENRTQSAIRSYDQRSTKEQQKRKPALKARSIMSSPVFTASPEDTLQHLLHIFRSHRFRHIPIVQKDSPIVGIVSDRDLLGVTELNEKRIADIMHTAVLVADPETPLHEIARVLFEERIGCLPLIEDNSLVGIITRSDLLRAIMNRAPLELWT